MLMTTRGGYYNPTASLAELSASYSSRRWHEATAQPVTDVAVVRPQDEELTGL